MAFNVVFQYFKTLPAPKYVSIHRVCMLMYCYIPVYWEVSGSHKDKSCSCCSAKMMPALTSESLHESSKTSELVQGYQMKKIAFNCDDKLWCIWVFGLSDKELCLNYGTAENISKDEKKGEERCKTQLIVLLGIKQYLKNFKINKTWNHLTPLQLILISHM